MIPVSNITTFITEKIRAKAALIGDEKPEVTDDFDIMGSGLFDSMEFLVMISEIEERFKVEVDFSDAEPESMSTIAGFIRSMKTTDA